MRLRHLVVVIPGIGGSVLESPSGLPMWGQDRGRVVKAVMDPDRLSVAESATLVPTDLLRSITVLPPFPFTIYGYGGLVGAIERAFDGVRVDIGGRDDVDPAADVALFPYDFRLGVEHAARRLQCDLERRLSALTGDARLRRVIVIGHSMGGLVARFWLGPLGGAPSCRALLTVGTPHRGAPKALDWLVNGVRFGPVHFPRLTEVLRDWPAVYDLLPRYRAIAYPGHNGGVGHTIYPHELPDSVATTAFLRRAADSYAMHKLIQQEWEQLPARPDVVVLFGRGHATPARAWLVGSTLEVSKRDAEWLPNPGWAGDGSVAHLSAIPIELADAPNTRLAVPDRHQPMSSTAAIIEVLRNYTAESTHWVQRDAPDHPWLGVDMDDTIVDGQPLEVTARILGLPHSVGPATAVWVIVRDADTAQRVARVRMRPDGDGFTATVDGLRPGDYTVTVEAVAVPTVDRITCTDVLNVVEVEP